ncbi:MAG: hypothetical protein AABZ12_12255 [Planctomycetota bacterium]
MLRRTWIWCVLAVVFTVPMGGCQSPQKQTQASSLTGKVDDGSEKKSELQSRRDHKGARHYRPKSAE